MQSHRNSDNELWVLVSRHDDQPAFEQLYRRYMRVLIAVIYKWLDDKSEAEDILQEIFLNLWERRSQIILKGDIYTYLYSMARYKIFDCLREKKLTDQQIRAWVQISGEGLTHETSYFEEELQRREALVASELTQLPAQMKRVYLLRIEQQKSILEIAAELRISPNTVRNHLQQIRKRLQSAALKCSSFLLFF